MKRQPRPGHHPPERFRRVAAPFDLIVPCGIRERGVTSVAKLLGREVEVEEAMERLARRVLEVFEREAAA